MEKVCFAERILWVGVGCQQGVRKLAIQKAIEWVFAEYDLDLATIAGIATLDRKADEIGLADYCRESGLFLKTYRPERLNSVTIDRQTCMEQNRSSRLVSSLVETASVAEAAALCAAQADILLVPKQKLRLDPDSGWVTIAIAQANLI